jgi:hypothetical protein
MKLLSDSHPDGREMRIAIAGSFALLLACASDFEVPADSAANVKAAEAPPASPPVDALAANFNPDNAAPGSEPAPAAAEYTCPHHPEVVSDKPGICPKCKMDLVPKKPEPKKTGGEPGHDHGTNDHTSHGAHP